jgi:hypothetical protein
MRSEASYAAMGVEVSTLNKWSPHSPLPSSHCSVMIIAFHFNFNPFNIFKDIVLQVVEKCRLNIVLSCLIFRVVIQSK